MQNFITNLFEPKTNAPEITILLRKLLKVNISETTILNEIEEHPDYPSLLSVSDVLSNYGIENMGVRFDPNQLSDLPCPFITQLVDKNSPVTFFTVVKEVKEDSVNFFDPQKHQWTTLTKQDFLKNCLGVALLAEAKESAGEKDYANKVKQENNKKAVGYLTGLLIPVIFVIAAIVAFMQYGAGALLPVTFTAFTLIGTVVCSLLLWYEVDQYNPVLQQICSAGKKVNCSAVLQSKASKFAGISWSVIGFSYFTGLLLLLLFMGITNPVVLFSASWLNAVAVPYVIFSLYYQWRIAKQWCVLCLSVQAVLLLQLSTAIAGGWHTVAPISTITAGFVLAIITAFAIPFIIASILLPALQKAKDSKRINNELQKLKHNRQIFEALLQKQKQVTVNPEGLGITLGNPNGSYKLIKVCNPYCGPCAKAHIPMEELLESNPDLQLQIVFTATNNAGDDKAPPVKHLLAIAEKHDEPKVKQALDDWYLAEKKDYNAFAARYPMNGELNRQGEKIAAMRDWCDKVEIEATPTFFISLPAADGENAGERSYYQLPRMYKVNDLKYFFSV